MERLMRRYTTVFSMVVALLLHISDLYADQILLPELKLPAPAQDIEQIQASLEELTTFEQAMRERNKPNGEQSERAIAEQLLGALAATYHRQLGMLLNEYSLNFYGALRGLTNGIGSSRYLPDIDLYRSNYVKLSIRISDQKSQLHWDPAVVLARSMESDFISLDYLKAEVNGLSTWVDRICATSSISDALEIKRQADWLYQDWLDYVKHSQQWQQTLRAYKWGSYDQQTAAFEPFEHEIDYVFEWPLFDMKNTIARIEKGLDETDAKVQHLYSLESIDAYFDRVLGEYNQSTFNLRQAEKLAAELNYRLNPAASAYRPISNDDITRLVLELRSLYKNFLINYPTVRKSIVEYLEDAKRYLAQIEQNTIEMRSTIEETTAFYARVEKAWPELNKLMLKARQCLRDLERDYVNSFAEGDSSKVLGGTKSALPPTEGFTTPGRFGGKLVWQLGEPLAGYIDEPINQGLANSGMIRRENESVHRNGGVIGFTTTVSEDCKESHSFWWSVELSGRKLSMAAYAVMIETQYTGSDYSGPAYGEPCPGSTGSQLTLYAPEYREAITSQRSWMPNSISKTIELPPPVQGAELEVKVDIGVNRPATMGKPGGTLQYNVTYPLVAK